MFSTKIRSLQEVVRAAASHGLAQLGAEDATLDGLHVTLGGRRQKNFGSCSYVGLETDERLKDAACEAVRRFGVQFASSRAYVSSPLYAEFEELLERIFQAPVVVAQTTSLGHFAALPVLIGKGDAVLADQHVHASVQSVFPTLREAGVDCRFVRHNRLDLLEERVRSLGAGHRHIWYLADGVYSMSGGTAPVDELRELLARHEQLHLYLDDAHGMSWTGRSGRGFVLGSDPIHPRMVVALSLAKAFSASGAALVFPNADWARTVRECGSTMIFSGPLQPALLGAGIASARIHLSPEIAERQRQLAARIELFAARAREHGVPLDSFASTPIRFVPIGSESVTRDVAKRLMDEGYFTNLATYPAVAKGRAGLRIALTIHQPLEDIGGLVERIDAWTAPRTVAAEGSA
jgi:7-keto-8-aminopelargonate synthetase-like enzyme